MDQEAQELPKVPSQAYDLTKLAGVRRKILDDVCYPYYGLTLAGELFVQFVGDLHRGACQRAPVQTLAESVRHLAGREFTRAAAEELAWRMAGNLHRLRSGRPVHPWVSQSEPEWVPLEIEAAGRQVRTFKARSESQKARANEDGLVRQAGVLIEARVLAGLPAGLVYRRFWSSEYCHIIKQSMGFSRYNRERYSRAAPKVRDWPFSDPREFFGMRLHGLVWPLKSKGGELHFEVLKATGPGLTHNRRLMTLRTREEYECPLGYTTDDVECYACPAGLDTCAAACHRRTYVQATCARCKRPDAFHDPSAVEDICVDCSALTE